ncbi:eukaryotic translation initiation factor 4E transporter [Nilaparvata lugens]|uniref:eukaryotic translation initiation factor 4E transporter n=1 Tax=Nilaparvata lugens TaxID=108931 RepID=UPI00193C8825|nr:eukaryotic translation initiation factor 4E transporter [Nilaparvata lugens]
MSNLLVQSDLKQISEVLESDRSSILSIESGANEKTKETVDTFSVNEDVGDTFSDVEDDNSADDNAFQPSNDLQMPSRQYSREFLLQLRESPHSSIFPSCLEKAPKSVLATYLTGKDQSNDKKLNDSANEENSNDVKRKQFKKKNASEKEEPGTGKKHLNVQDRLKKDDIVLSPQRRSFNTGCSVSSSIFNILPTANRNISTRHRLDSLSSSKDIRDTDSSNEHRKQRLDSLAQNQPRDFSQLSRDNRQRLNRGRLMSRDSAWETRDSDSSWNTTYDKRSTNNSGGGNDRRQNNDEERNRYGYFDRKKNYNDDHVRIEKEPEWFSAGPTSQYDVIELQGFEDYKKEMQSKKNKKAEAKNKTKETKSTDTKSEPNKQKKEKKDPIESQLLSKESEQKLKQQKDDTPTDNGPSEKTAKNVIDPMSPSLPNDIDAFLNFNELLVDDDETEITKSRTSKFSLWCQQPESSSNNVVNWISDKEPMVTSTSAFSEVFSEKNTNEVKHSDNKSDHSNWPSFTENKHTPEKPASDGSTLFEKLLMAPTSSATVIGNSTVGKVHSVEELEAHLRKPQQTTKKEEDMAAFKKLFNQSKPSATTNPNPVSAAFNQIPPQPQPQPRVADVPQPQFGFFTVAADPTVAARLQQAQTVEMLKMGRFAVPKPQLVAKPTDLAAVITPALGIFPKPVPTLVKPPQFIRPAVADSLLVTNPIARQMLHKLKEGQLTIAQLLNPNYLASLPAGYREMAPVVVEFWLQSAAMAESVPLAAHGVQTHIVVPPPQEQLNVPGAPFTQRIPSPQQIAMHTQGIMQNALVKKKLEEQRENFKRRQEMWSRARSPATDDSQLLSTFTPTSVLRQQKRKADAANPAGGDQFMYRANDGLQQMQMQQQAKKLDMLMNKGRPIMKKSDGSQLMPVETPYPVPGHPGQFRSQTPAPQPTAAQHFLAGFLHPHDQQQQSHMASRSANNLASATACLQGLLLDRPSVTSQQGSFNRQPADDGTACLQGLLLDRPSVTSQQASFNRQPADDGTACLQGLLLDRPSVTSQKGSFNRQPADEGGPLSRWLPTKLIEDGLAGKLPDIPTQKMLSVEDLERVQTVHN